VADLKKRLECNAVGDFFVDASCIDCDVCRELCPECFGDGENTACVVRQPATEEEREKALLALLSCPVGAIGTVKKEGIREVIDKFPIRVEGEVYRCGLSSKKSYGGMSYLVLHPEGNWLIDSPRGSARLLKRLSLMGGLRYIFLTHEDDVADAGFYAESFGAKVIIHQKDSHTYKDAHVKIGGEEPVRMGDFTLIPTPGHTRGHTVLLYKNFLFTGDHLWYSPERGRLWASKDYCWYSWEEQVRSLEKLLDFDFEWVLPAHGRSVRTESWKIKEQIRELIKR